MRRLQSFVACFGVVAAVVGAQTPRFRMVETSSTSIAANAGDEGLRAAGDFNGDGFLDLTTYGGFLLGEGDGQFHAGPDTFGYFSSGFFGHLIGDFDGDGVKDVMATAGAT